jgi:ABC-type nitrate/sulfonate/bicarbonate transport system substrate-binding protein
MGHHRLRAAIPALIALTAVPGFVAGAGTSEPPGTAASGEWFTEERCAANRDAGTITYLTGFEYAAAASMIDVFVAEQAGYYDELCLDVEVVSSSIATANYPLIAGNEAQFASGGSFSEVVEFAAANDAELVAVTVEGRFPIDVLIVKPGVAETLAGLEGTTIGVKGAITRAVAAMLAGAGLVEGEGYQTVLLDGYDPLVHIAIDDIVGFPGYKSNEPGALDRAGIEYDLFDPADYDVPGSFGVIYTSRTFLDEHPAAAEDFVRATMRGLADAIAEPEAALQSAFDLAERAGGAGLLSTESELFRWQTDAALLRDSYGPDEPFGVPDRAMLQAELDAYDAVGLFTEELPPLESVVDADLAAGVYGEDGTVIWPD